MIQATVHWKSDGSNFVENRYSRRHTWEFDGGLKVAASSSPDIVPVPMSDASAVDPEEAYVASISSCHMLWFLAIAAKKGFSVDAYCDEPVGQLGRNADGKAMIEVVTLRPEISWASGSEPNAAEIVQMHEVAHAECFIANSSKSEIRVEAR